MKRLLLTIDRSLRGPAALAGVVVGSALLLLLIFRPLPWSHFPHVGRILSASWLHLAIGGSIAYSGAAVVARRAGLPVEMVTCVTVGALWKFTSVFSFLPFNFSRWLLVYGVAGLTAHCFRRAMNGLRETVSAPTPPARSESTGDPREAGT